MNKKTAQKAAKWWADHLRGDATLDHGDNSNTGAMIKGLASMLQQTEAKKISSDQIDKFEILLSKRLEDVTISHFHIGVDYNPDVYLSEVATEAGINPGMATFPWKTSMWIENGAVKVAVGYDGKAENL